MENDKWANTSHESLSINSTKEIVVADTAIKHFAFKLFKYLYELDRFAAFWTTASNVTEWNDASFRTIKDVERGIYLSGFLRADKTDDGQYFPYGFELDGHTWYLSTNWCKQEFVPETNSRYGLSAVCLQRLIEHFYPSYSMEIADNGYRLLYASVSYCSDESRQVIYFGAPGTGKSHAVDGIVKKVAPKRNVRTTFHPDTDYSSFVGCFKPAMRDGKIVYAFTAQAFTKAYVGAWSDLSKPFFLVIEEINRGNCAQIFGDIFQLLDRNENGESSYGIRPDSDLQAYISDKLSLVANIPEEIRSGEEMRLPANLFIYATMNTSDQSLFPIDSAFKRRWDWRYTAIKPGEKDHVLVVGVHRYNWTSFIRKVNSKIYDLTKSEDKQLGYWFIMPDVNGEIRWERFVSKAIFYIWNDIVKDYAAMEKEDSAFGRKFAFTTFFDENGNPLLEQTIAFLDALGVEKMPQMSKPTDNIEDVDPEDVEQSEVNDLNDVNSTKGTTKGSQFSYTLDGVEYSGIGKAIIAIVTKLGENYTFDEIADSFNRIVRKKFKNEPAIKAVHPNTIRPDENGRKRWYVNPFYDKDGNVFSLIALWPDSYSDRIKQWVENYPDLFPKGFAQIKKTMLTHEAAD